MVGYCCPPNINLSARCRGAQWLSWGFVSNKLTDSLTEVVLTPQLKAGAEGEGAGGVGTHSKSLPLPESLILLALLSFAGSCERDEGGGREQVPSGDVCEAQVRKRAQLPCQR